MTGITVRDGGTPITVTDLDRKSARVLEPAHHSVARHDRRNNRQRQPRHRGLAPGFSVFTWSAWRLSECASTAPLPGGPPCFQDDG
jgi:hypothetical protein